VSSAFNHHSWTCLPDWLPFEDSCYFISTMNRIWKNSQEFCAERGGHLAIIHTAEEQYIIMESLFIIICHWNAYWFGISDEKLEGSWQWVDGTELVGGFWEVGEPNNHINEDCGYIVKTQVLSRKPTSSWYDAPCSMSLPFICEKEVPSKTAV
uniref:C-type lectin domain-containing protein n=1 Tax=Denticeps clupeoides TaxID=299321 RepID=A0AAY4DNH5_9TELE